MNEQYFYTNIVKKWMLAPSRAMTSCSLSAKRHEVHQARRYSESDSLVTQSLLISSLGSSRLVGWHSLG